MAVGLQLANRNDYVSVQDHINNNLTNLEEMIDNNSGKKITGYIQDEGEKVLGNYYLDKLTTGLFKCTKSGNINYNSSEHFEDNSNLALRNDVNVLKKTSFKNLDKAQGIKIPFGEFKNIIVTINHEPLGSGQSRVETLVFAKDAVLTRRIYKTNWYDFQLISNGYEISVFVFVSASTEGSTEVSEFSATYF